jgi:hypothetical protein
LQTLRRLVPMIVVGAIDDDGYRTAYSQGTNSELSVSAVGNVNCPSSDGVSTIPTIGTSLGMT